MTGLSGTTATDAERAAYVRMSNFKASQAEAAFELWDDLIAKDMNRTPSFDGNGAPQNLATKDMIQFYYHNSSNGTAAPARSYNGSNIANSFGGNDWKMYDSQVEIRAGDARSDEDNDVKNGHWGFETFLHEIGHSLGLWHPGPYNGTVSSSQVYMFQDNRQFSIMSYNNPGAFGNGANWGANLEAGAQLTLSSQTGIAASTPMVYDIAAIQAIYGADPTTRTGSDVYGFNATFIGSNAAKADPYRFSTSTGSVFSIYDADGNQDRLDGQLFNDNQLIDLNPGSYSSMGREFGLTGQQLINNVGIAFNTTIEDAYGGSGNDTIFGNDADNRLIGNGGNDTFRGGGGTNSLEGGEGSDTYVISDEARIDFVNDSGSTGIDTVEFTHASTLDWAAGVFLGDVAHASFPEGMLERYVGSNDADRISMSVNGSPGGVKLVGNGGSDQLLGGRGGDNIQGGTGGDIIDGRRGIDTANFADHFGNFSGGWNIDLIAGMAITRSKNSFLLLSERDQLISIEGVIGSAGNDSIQSREGIILSSLLVPAVIPLIDGGAGIDTLNLSPDIANSLAISGQQVADDLVTFTSTGAGKVETTTLIRGGILLPFQQGTGHLAFKNIEFLNTGEGDDVITNAKGKIVDVTVQPTGVPLVDAGNGNDTLNLSDTISNPLALNGQQTTNDVVTFSAAGAGHVQTATQIRVGLETIKPANGHLDFKSIETLNTGSGNDKVTGSASAEVVILGAGNDTMLGGGGDDSITGGLGADTLNGGTGADRFIFNATNEGSDSIVNFDTSDFFTFKGSAFGGLGAGTLGAASFWSNTTGLAHDATDRFMFNKTDDTLWYDANGNVAGGTIVKIADMTNDFNVLTNADILIF